MFVEVVVFLLTWWSDSAWIELKRDIIDKFDDMSGGARWESSRRARNGWVAKSMLDERREYRRDLRGGILGGRGCTKRDDWEDRRDYDGPVGFAVDLESSVIGFELEDIVENYIGAKIGKVRGTRRRNERRNCVAYHGALFRCRSKADLELLLKCNEIRYRMEGACHNFRFGDPNRIVHARAVYMGPRERAPTDYVLEKKILKDIPYEDYEPFAWLSYSNRGSRKLIARMTFEKFYEFLEAARACTQFKNLRLLVNFKELTSVGIPLALKQRPADHNRKFDTFRNPEEMNEKQQSYLGKDPVQRSAGCKISVMERENESTSSKLSLPSLRDYCSDHERESVNAEVNAKNVESQKNVKERKSYNFESPEPRDIGHSLPTKHEDSIEVGSKRALDYDQSHDCNSIGESCCNHLKHMHTHGIPVKHGIEKMVESRGRVSKRARPAQLETTAKKVEKRSFESQAKPQRVKKEEALIDDKACVDDNSSHSFGQQQQPEIKVHIKQEPELLPDGNELPPEALMNEM